VIAAGPEEVARFRLLASAIAGQLVDVAPAPFGTPAWTDGATIFVDGEANPAIQLRSLTVQAALLSAGSLDREIVARLSRRPVVCRRYLAVEGHRALAGLEEAVPLPVRDLIDRATAGRSDSPAESLAIAISSEVVSDPPDVFGTIRPRQICAAAGRSVGGLVSKPQPGHQREAVRQELEEATDAANPKIDVFSSPVGGGGPIGRLLSRMLDQGRSPGQGRPSADAPTHWTRRAGPATSAVSLATRTASVLDRGPGLQHRGFSYPEWDMYGRRYRSDWCHVMEIEPSADTSPPFTVPTLEGLRRPLARLELELERRHRQMQGDDIDIDAAVEARVELLAGAAPDEAVYVDSVRCGRDLSVLLLLDVSGSAGEPGVAGARVHDHQRAAAAAVTATLDRLGDRVALYAFRSHGRSSVEILPIKRFGEGLDNRVLRRVASLVPGAYTRLGSAIRHGGAVIEREGGTARRLLVVLSDGFAYDHGYEGAYAEADARRALVEVRRRGIGCLCLSIAAGSDAEALSRVFGTAAHATIPRGEHLASVVGPLFRSALRSAEVQRRVAQRRERTEERLKIEGKPA
jgi:hypothetical protein